MPTTEEGLFVAGGDCDAEHAHVGEVLVREPLAFGGNEIAADIDSFEELGPMSCADASAEHHHQRLAKPRFRPFRTVRLGRSFDSRKFRVAVLRPRSTDRAMLDLGVQRRYALSPSAVS